MKLAIAVLALGLAGCALTPAQLKAIGDSKTGTTVCFHVDTMGFKSTTVVTNAAGGTQPALLQVAPNCATGNARGVQ